MSGFSSRRNRGAPPSGWGEERAHECTWMDARWRGGGGAGGEKLPLPLCHSLEDGAGGTTCPAGDEERGRVMNPPPPPPRDKEIPGQVQHLEKSLTLSSVIASAGSQSLLAGSPGEIKPRSGWTLGLCPSAEGSGPGRSSAGWGGGVREQKKGAGSGGGRTVVSPRPHALRSLCGAVSTQASCLLVWSDPQYRGDCSILVCLPGLRDPALFTAGKAWPRFSPHQMAVTAGTRASRQLGDRVRDLESSQSPLKPGKVWAENPE